MKTLESIANWGESKTTEGSGTRFLNKFYAFIDSQMDSINSFPPCKFTNFNKRMLI